MNNSTYELLSSQIFIDMKDILFPFLIVMGLIIIWYSIGYETFDQQIIWAVVNNGSYYNCQLVPNGYQYSPTFDTLDQCYDWCMSKYQSSCVISS